MGKAATSGPEIGFAQKRIWLSGVVRTHTEADELIETINALKPLLKEKDSDQPQEQE